MKRFNSWTCQTALANNIKCENVRRIVSETLSCIDKECLFGKKEDFTLAEIYEGLFKINSKGVLVSVVVPVYNVEKYLGRCLDSIIDQTMNCIEIVCVNDGSTDSSPEILKEYAKRDKRIKVINKLNGGLSSARNYGIFNSIGNYIMFVDSDDWIEPTTLEKAISKMICKVDVVAWGADIVNEGLDDYNQGVLAAKRYHEIKIVGERDINSDIVSKTTYTAWNKLLKRSIIEKYSIKFTEGRLFEDNDFMVKYLVHCKDIFFLNEYLYHYVQRPNSIMEKVRNKKSDRTSDHFYIFDSIYNHFAEFDISGEWSVLLTKRYLSHLSQAYKCAPNEKKSDIRNMATKFAEKYDVKRFAWDCLSDVVNQAYHKVNELNEYIVTLTSYPDRISCVSLTIESIMNQSFKPDKVVLWLASSQFPNEEEDLPEDLLNLKKMGLCIEWCEDIKSYKKLLPSLKEFPEAVLITTDDDVIYDKNWLKILIDNYKKNPYCIQAHRAHRIMLDSDGSVLPYGKWIKNDKMISGEPEYLMFQTGVGGVLYPPHCFKKNVFDVEKLSKLCPHGDDIWFWGHAVLNGFAIHVPNEAIKYPKLIEGSQDVGLWHENVEKCENDIQLQAFINCYPELINILRREYRITKYFRKNTNLKIENSHKELNCTNVRKSTIKYNELLLNYITARFDMQLLSSTGGILVENNLKPYIYYIYSPEWLQKNGKGYVVESYSGEMNLKLTFTGDGEFKLLFRSWSYVKI